MLQDIFANVKGNCLATTFVEFVLSPLSAPRVNLSGPKRRKNKGITVPPNAVNMETNQSHPSSLPIADGWPANEFAERRDPQNQRQSSGFERRQFSNSMAEYSDEAAELGRAVDQYKLVHRRRFINYEELLSVIKNLGYEKSC